MIVSVVISAALVVVASPSPQVTRAVTRDTNYTLGQPFDVTVGESAVRVKSYLLSTTTADAYTSQSSLRIKAGLGTTPIAAGQQLRIVGRMEEDGISYDVVEMARYSSLGVFVVYGLAIGPNNQVYGRGVNFGNGTWRRVIGKQTVEGAPSFVRSTVQVSESREVQENFEIVYLGRDASSIRFQYREYTKDDLARSAFSQDIVYPATAKTVRFRTIEMRVDNLDADSIGLTIMHDQ